MSLKKKASLFIPSGMRPIARGMYQALQDVKESVQAMSLAPARRRRREVALSSLNTSRRKVTLFLAPEAALEPFFASHVLIARVLKDAGHETLLLTCNGVLPTCSAKLAHMVTHTAPNKGGRTCRHCRAVVNRTCRDYDLADVSIESLLSAEALSEIDDILLANFAQPWDIVEDGIEIGRACLGEALRTQRKLSLDELDDVDKAFIRALAHSSLAIYRSVKLLAKSYDVRHIAYFGDYAFFIAPQIFARRNSISLTNVSHAYNRDIDRRFLNLRPGHGFSHMMSQIDDWPTNSQRPIPADAVFSILDGGLYRMRGFGGASTYSPNWLLDTGDIRTQLGLPRGGKLLVAYSNSTDELLCNREILRVMGIPYGQILNPFQTQIEWLQSLIAWVEARADLRLVIRLHPRMAKGHRHSRESSEAERMRREFSKLPPNVAIVWPEDKISSYNIGEDADVILTAWSSIGLEFARLGVPLISAFQRIGPWPTGKFNLFSETREGYFSLVERALGSEPTMASILDAFRWTYTLNWSPLIDISDVTPDPDYRHVPPYRRPANRDLILATLVENQDLTKLSQAKLAVSPDAVRTEHMALEASMGLAFKYLITGDYMHPPRNYTICLQAQRPVQIGEDGGPRIEVGAENEVGFKEGDHSVHRTSPLLARLARAIALRTYD